VPGEEGEVEDTLQGLDLVVQLPELRSDVGRHLAAQVADAERAADQRA